MMQTRAKDFRKRLFYWELPRVPLFLLLSLTLWPSVNLAQQRIYQQIESATTFDWFVWLTWVPVSEFLTVDTHVWGDYVYGWTGVDLRLLIWLFSMPAAVALDFLWLRGRLWAGTVRTTNWCIACLSYFAWTVLSPDTTGYDYWSMYLYLSYWKWAWWIQVYSVTWIAMMWTGVILVTGYMIYKHWQLSGSRLAPVIAALLSLGIPGTGQIASGRRRRGLMFLLLGVIAWIVGWLFLYQNLGRWVSIPLVAWWLFSSWDAYKLNRARAPSQRTAN